MAASLSNTFTLTPSSDTEILITRMFNAPRDLVFKAMSSCEHLPKWLGPSRLKMTHCEMEFKIGGGYRYVLSDSEGGDYGFRGEYREIDPPNGMTQTFEFEGMPGHIAVEKMTLEDLGGQTKMSIHCHYESVYDRDGIIQSGMEAGARESYDRLESYLETGSI